MTLHSPGHTDAVQIQDSKKKIDTYDDDDMMTIGDILYKLPTRLQTNVFIAVTFLLVINCTGFNTHVHHVQCLLVQHSKQHS